mmetsp:Transcript_22488/g.56230  ORF Transcript_22488/g.56230 Transcript_22488/m.56230 type:complete len:225 (+) Transcript_22488:166-840(+)
MCNRQRGAPMVNTPRWRRQGPCTPALPRRSRRSSRACGGTAPCKILPKSRCRAPPTCGSRTSRGGSAAWRPGGSRRRGSRGRSRRARACLDGRRMRGRDAPTMTTGRKSGRGTTRPCSPGTPCWRSASSSTSSRSSSSASWSSSTRPGWTRRRRPQASSSQTPSTRSRRSSTSSTSPTGQTLSSSSFSSTPASSPTSPSTSTPRATPPPCPARSGSSCAGSRTA